ncbi:hypothetical protein GBA65_05220 [Rubrobacter marinus]|uniref:Prepilin-type N-terminal cleavage/methylation domain-containing protein n=1 Tax=Rubrobacter marinus TaxID=2653852 RepID=A0A6G8PUZ3_9ACTN|nr:hypothetical protein [Rubrobacter marinus]QIN78017.1 hypothetical protein GBA65_05220 [Rubrobacter marinus]
MRKIRRHLLADETGFTLAEMMVAITVMIVVFFALHNIFSMSLRVFSFGNDKVEAVENARLGVERMERELRGAYSYDKSNASASDDHLFFNLSSPGSAAMPGSTQMTFGNELTSDMKLTCPSTGTCEFFTYKLTQPNSGAACTAAPCTLRRVNSSSASATGDALVESVALNGLSFSYFRADGTAVTANEGEIERVQVRLNVNVDGRTQVLTTNVDLRNRL